MRGLPKDGEPELDLSNVFALLNGSEPVSTASMRKFNEAFAPYGLPATAIKPSYGMAEATLFVSTTDMKQKATTIHVDREELTRGRFVTVADDAPTAVPQVACGMVSIDQWAAIVDSDTATEQPDGHIGEIWLHGANIGPATGAASKRRRTPSATSSEIARQPVAHRGCPRRRPVDAHR